MLFKAIDSPYRYILCARCLHAVDHLAIATYGFQGFKKLYIYKLLDDDGYIHTYILAVHLTC